MLDWRGAVLFVGKKLLAWLMAQDGKQPDPSFEFPKRSPKSNGVACRVAPADNGSVIPQCAMKGLPGIRGSGSSHKLITKSISGVDPEENSDIPRVLKFSKR
jgi:hypothetical protein